jgi:2-phosphosulfolactate phosphatase
MIDISISLTADQARKELITGSITVVIDVLRATSVIITALGNGADWVKPVIEVDAAWKLKKDHPDAILGGERDALKIKGFDNGNSPFEYSEDKVIGKGIILTTTNGTKALNNSHDADEVLIGAFLNMNSVADYIVKSEKRTHILCAGTRGDFSLDDFLCAGGIISGISIYSDVNLDDLGLLARKFWESEGSNNDKLRDCKHYNTLIERGFEKDLEYCLGMDTHDVVPRMESGKIQLLKA